MNKYFNQLKIDIPLLKIEIPGLESLSPNLNFFYTSIIFESFNIALSMIGLFLALKTGSK